MYAGQNNEHATTRAMVMQVVMLGPIVGNLPRRGGIRWNSPGGMSRSPCSKVGEKVKGQNVAPVCADGKF